MAHWSVKLDRQAEFLLKRHRRMLPETEIAAGARTANRKSLRLAQRNSVRFITKTTPLRRKAFIGRQGQSRFSNFKLFRSFNGVFKLVTKDFVLHRTGKIVQMIRNRRVRAEGGGLLRKRVSAGDKAFVIRKSAYRRQGGKLKTVKLASYGKIDTAFLVGTKSAARRVPVILHDEMKRRLDKYQRKLNP